MAERKGLIARIGAAALAGLEAAERAGPMIDRAVGIVSPDRGMDRTQKRRVMAAAQGYESALPSRRRRFHHNQMSGEALTRVSAKALREQARHLERNSDIATHILDKLTDFTVGANGIQVEFQPKGTDGKIHTEFARRLRRHYALHSQWPEVTWTFDRAQMERLAARTWFRDGEVLGQLVSGPRKDLEYGSDVPVAIECMEPDLLPLDHDIPSRNISQGIERNAWGRPSQYHLYRGHPGHDRAAGKEQTKAIPAERMLHVRTVTRFHQLRGVSIFATLIARLQDLHEYEDAERAANKLAADLVLKITHSNPESVTGAGTVDHNNPPVFRADSGMIMVTPDQGMDASFFDSKRPNNGADAFINGQLRRLAGGAGLSYSAVSGDYNGTYSAQRQELVENWPHYHALTGQFVAQWTRPSTEDFIRWELLTYGVPAGLDVSTAFDALYLGPPMPWIDPEKEANGRLMMVQAGFTSSAQVVRSLNGDIDEIYTQLAHEREERARLGISTSIDAAGTVPAVPSAEPGAAGGAAPARGQHLQVVK